jgi:hypothetical protein
MNIYINYSIQNKESKYGKRHTVYAQSARKRHDNGKINITRVPQEINANAMHCTV